MLGKGDGTLQPGAAYDAGTGPTTVAARDVDGDGRIDLVTVNYGVNNGALQNDLGVLLGKGDGTFAAGVRFAPAPVGPTGIALADLNGDGKPDAITGNGDGVSGSAGLFLNTSF
ncbi:MAG: VCBS repeat-containing protein [Myxococcales bacterium]|nr:VCBS repeat-containing protein [Myxococcales bacterium]